MKVPILLLLVAIVVIENGCLGQRTTPHSGRPGQTTPHHNRPTTPAGRGGAGHSANLVSANSANGRTTPRGGKGQSGNLLNAAGLGTAAKPQGNQAMKTTPRPNGKATTPRMGGTTARTTPRGATTARTTPKNAKLVQPRVGTGKPPTLPTLKPILVQPYPPAKDSFVQTFSVPKYSDPWLRSGNPYLYSLSTYLASNLTQTDNSTAYTTSLPMVATQPNELTSIISTANENLVERETTVELNTTTPMAFSISSTMDYGYTETSTNGMTTPEQLAATRKKLKRRVRINAETGKKQVLKRKKITTTVTEQATTEQ